jgi:ABC-2 type transport system ATP-binding protein
MTAAGGADGAPAFSGSEDGAPVRLVGIAKRYGAEEALRGVDLEIRGGTLGLLGPNGAGKSTLLKVLLGMVDFEGQASLFGWDPRVHPGEVRARVGYMPEGECGLPGFSAVDLCIYGAELSGLPPREAKDRAHLALGYVGLYDKRLQKIDGYSTGMKQKVKLAQAIAHDPDLLLLDEPTSGLDPRGREEMLTLIAEIPKRRGGALVVCSHVLSDIEAVCDRAIVLARGEVRAAGSLEELRSGTVGAYAVRLKGEASPFVRALEARGCNAMPGRDGALEVRLPTGAHTDLIFRAAQEANVQIRRLDPEQRTLERAFLDAVGE